MIMESTKKLKERIYEVLCALDCEERELLASRFGLNNGEAHTLEEVSKELYTNRDEIRTLEADSMRKLYQHNTNPEEFIHGEI